MIKSQIIDKIIADNCNKLNYLKVSLIKDLEALWDIQKKGKNASRFISFNNASVTPERSLYLSLIDSLSGIIITWAFVCAL